MSEPTDSLHTRRLARARTCLEGLSVGDALGERFIDRWSLRPGEGRIDPPPGPWAYTDDTAMALSVLRRLGEDRRIDPERLARDFARTFVDRPDRGYGAGAAWLLERVAAGGAPARLAAGLFGGQGSMGNGSAMRVGPVGAYFADDLDAVVDQAAVSARATHVHPEGQAGAIAAALACAQAWRGRSEAAGELSAELGPIIERTPEGAVKRGLTVASQLPAETPLATAVGTLGNGARVTCPDTIPLCLWLATIHGESYQDAIGQTLRAGGDVDTNCAIVGSIVVMRTGVEGIPPPWLEAREPLEI